MLINFIGDIHGYANELKILLAKLGYRKSMQGGWSTGDGIIVFLGDLIDRGPYQKQTVDIVRELCELGHATCLTGNHEFNAVGFVTERIDEPGKFVRSHSDNHIRQHQAFLDAFANDPYGYRETIAWFKTLPLWFDKSNARAVHAYWNTAAQNDLSSLLNDDHSPRDQAFYEQTGVYGSRAWKARETLLNGLEIKLPDGVSFRDYYDTKRHRIRLNWWQSQQTTFREAAVIDDSQRYTIPDLPLPEKSPSYEGPLCFFGHYWMRGEPRITHPQAICLDYSIALTDGVLCAYQFRGETKARCNHLVWVNKIVTTK
tara:strand:- start:919 stop:1860 length:942 start_codon:yes stop_codon:yes gene_type:complete